MATEPKIIEKDDLKDIVQTFLSEGGTLADIRGFEEKDMEVIYSMGYQLYNHGKYKDAEDVFKFLSFYNHLERKYLMGLGACRQMLKNYEGAVQAYGYAAMLDVEDPSAHLHAADCLLALERLGEAESALEATVHWAGDKPEHAKTKGRAQGLLQLIKEKDKTEGAQS